MASPNAVFAIRATTAIYFRPICKVNESILATYLHANREIDSIFFFI